MGVTVDIVPCAGWQRNLRLANGALELVITLEVGPRILSLAAGPRQRSVFKLFPQQAGGQGEREFRSRGGHRLWVAPEDRARTYFPDNCPVAHELLDAGRVRLTAPPEETGGLQKQLDVALDAQRARVTVTHRLLGLGATAAPLSPWALSVMAPGGTAIVPQPPPGEFPRDLLPNRHLVLWPYMDLGDPRLRLGRRYLTLRQDPARAPLKIGLLDEQGWAAYLLGDTLFVKRFACEPGRLYPDRGCNCELFTDAEMLELESLGPLRLLGPGAVAEHTEEWQLVTGVQPLDLDDETAIAAALAAVPPWKTSEVEHEH